MFMDKMIEKLLEQEKRLKEKEVLIETTYRSPKIDVDELLKKGYISAEDYEKSHQ